MSLRAGGGDAGVLSGWTDHQGRRHIGLVPDGSVTAIGLPLHVWAR